MIITAGQRPPWEQNPVLQNRFNSSVLDKTGMSSMHLDAVGAI